MQAAGRWRGGDTAGTMEIAVRPEVELRVRSEAPKRGYKRLWRSALGPEERDDDAAAVKKGRATSVTSCSRFSAGLPVVPIIFASL